MCPILKKLSSKLQPFDEVIQIKDEILASKKGNNVRVLEHLISYLNYQFGEKITGINLREREDGGHWVRISNWDVDINILYDINKRILDHYTGNHSLSNIIQDNAIQKIY
jgi:hypothetical protein